MLSKKRFFFTAPPPEPCPEYSEDMVAGDVAYKMFDDEKRTWHEAKHFCSNQKGNLPTLLSRNRILAAENAIASVLGKIPWVIKLA